VTGNWKLVIWPDEPPFTLFATLEGVYVRTPEDVDNQDFTVPTVKFGQ
jgi:hypothetical protein